MAKARKLNEKVAMPAIKALMRGTPNYTAIETLVKQTREPRVVVSTIRLLLTRWNNSKNNRFVADMETLGLMIRLVDMHPLRSALCDTVVKTVAEAGYIGRFPELPQSILKRNPDEREIILLVSAYVNATASQCDHTENKLRKLARMYCTKEVAEREIARVDAFKKEWGKDDLC